MRLPVRTTNAKTPRYRQHHGRRATKLVVPERPLTVLIDHWLELTGMLWTPTKAELVVASGDDGTKTTRPSEVRKSWSDRTAVLPITGKTLLIEVKAEDGAYQPGQPEFLREARSSGALVVEPRTLADVVDAVEAEYVRLGLLGDRRLWRLRRAIGSYRKGVGAR